MTLRKFWLRSWSRIVKLEQRKRFQVITVSGGSEFSDSIASSQAHQTQTHLSTNLFASLFQAYPLLSSFYVTEALMSRKRSRLVYKFILNASNCETATARSSFLYIYICVCVRGCVCVHVYVCVCVYTEKWKAALLSPCCIVSWQILQYAG